MQINNSNLKNNVIELIPLKFKYIITNKIEFHFFIVFLILNL